MNEFRFFRLINAIFFIFGCWLLSEKFILVLPEKQRLCPSLGVDDSPRHATPAGSYAYMSKFFS